MGRRRRRRWRPLEPDFAWNACDFFIVRDDDKVKVIAEGLTADACAGLGAMNPAATRAWCDARKRKTAKVDAAPAEE